MRLIRKILFVFIAILTLFISQNFASAQEGYTGDEEIIIDGITYKRTETEFQKTKPTNGSSSDYLENPFVDIPYYEDLYDYIKSGALPSLDGQSVAPGIVCEDVSGANCYNIQTPGIAVGEPVYGEFFGESDLWQKVEYDGEVYYAPVDVAGLGYTSSSAVQGFAGASIGNANLLPPLDEKISTLDYLKGYYQRNPVNTKTITEDLFYSTMPAISANKNLLKFENEFLEFKKTGLYNSVANGASNVGNYFLEHDNAVVRYPSHLIKGVGSSVAGVVGGLFSMVAYPAETVQGLGSLGQYVWNTPKEAALGAWGAVKNFGIESVSSPEKFAENVGKLIPDIAAFVFTGGSVNAAKTGVSVASKASRISHVTSITGKASKFTNVLDNIGSSFKLLAKSKAGKTKLTPSSPFSSVDTWLKTRNMTPGAKKFFKSNIDEIEKVRKSYEPIKQALEKKLNTISLKTGVEVSHGAIKSAQRMVQKVFTTSGYSKKVSNLTDIVRSRFVVNDFKSARVVYRKLKKEFGQTTKPVVDRLKAGSKSTSTGYRSIKGIWKVKGKPVEIQIVPKEIYKVGDKTHKIYQKVRSLNAVKTITKNPQKLQKLKDTVKNLNKKATDISEKAWSKFNSRVSDLKKTTTKKWYQFWK